MSEARKKLGKIGFIKKFGQREQVLRLIKENSEMLSGYDPSPPPEMTEQSNRRKQVSGNSSFRRSRDQSVTNTTESHYLEEPKY